MNQGPKRSNIGI